MIFGINTPHDISKLSQISLVAREITYNNFEISLVVFMPNITTNHAITCTSSINIVIKSTFCTLHRMRSAVARSCHARTRSIRSAPLL